MITNKKKNHRNLSLRHISYENGNNRKIFEKVCTQENLLHTILRPKDKMQNMRRDILAQEVRQS